MAQRLEFNLSVKPSDFPAKVDLHQQSALGFYYLQQFWKQQQMTYKITSNCLSIVLFKLLPPFSFYLSLLCSVVGDKIIKKMRKIKSHLLSYSASGRISQAFKLQPKNKKEEVSKAVQVGEATLKSILNPHSLSLEEQLYFKS